MSRYAATTPTLLRWFTRYNAGKPYRDQVKPFNFLLAFQPASVPEQPVELAEDEAISPGARQRERRRARLSGADLPHAIAPFDRDPAAAVRRCFDRQTGRKVEATQLQSYRQALAQYHLHPEAKFGHSDFTDAALTTRRHILAMIMDHIGKEANRWEEQFYLGEDPEAQIVYGAAPEERDRAWGSLLQRCQPFTVRQLASAAELSVGEVSMVLSGQRKPSRELLAKLQRVVSALEGEGRLRTKQTEQVLTAVRARCEHLGLRTLAQEIGVDPGHLARILAGQRKPSRILLAKMEAPFSTELEA